MKIEMLQGLSLAGRIEAVMNMLHPQVVEECPTCGHYRLVEGAPLISKETAAALLEAAEEP